VSSLIYFLDGLSSASCELTQLRFPPPSMPPLFSNSQLRSSSPPSPISPFRPHQPSALLFLSMVSTLLQIKLPSSPPRPYRPGQIRPFLRSLSSDRRSSLPPVLDRDARQAQFWESGEEGEKAFIRGGRDDHSRVSPCPALGREQARRRTKG